MIVRPRRQPDSGVPDLPSCRTTAGKSFAVPDDNASEFIRYDAWSHKTHRSSQNPNNTSAMVKSIPRSKPSLPLRIGELIALQ